MKLIHLLLFTLLMSGCAHQPARVFIPTDTAALGRSITDTHTSIVAAKKNAETIYQKGTVAGSPEVMQLKLNLDTADSRAAQAEQAMADFKRADEEKFKAINTEVQEKTDRAVNAETKLQKVQPHLMRLRELAFATLFLGALLMWLGPIIATSTGYGATIRAIPIIGGIYDLATGIAAVLGGAALLTLFLTLAGLFGWL